MLSFKVVDRQARELYFSSTGDWGWNAKKAKCSGEQIPKIRKL
jgi:hypothetical protein